MPPSSYSRTTIEDAPGRAYQPESAVSHNSPVVYGLGTFGLESTYKVFVGFYVFFYVDVLGLTVALAAVINVIYAIWDAVNDPLVGYLSDNTRTRWGRRRPWLLTSLPFYGVFLVLIYAVPEAFRGGEALFWYALVAIFLFETASTVLNTNYDALFPELFQRFRERTRASALRHGFGMAGELVGFALTPIIYTQFGFVGMAWFFAIMAGILLTFSILRNSEDPNAQKLPPVNLKGAFGDVLGDRPFWLFTWVATLLWFTTGLYTLATPFWARYTLKASPQAPSLIFATVFLVAILSVSLWSKLVRDWGIQRTWLWAIGVMILSAIVLGLASSLAVGVLAAVVAGLGLGGVKVCREMILASLVDQSIARTGRRREGIYYSLNRFIGRLSKLLESLALVLLGVLFGYVSGENPGPDPENAFRFLISVFPFICLVLGWMLARKLDLQHER
ncbi:MAG: MFS transporter [Anaerolineales bacterium]|nr:MAG: MFS transporter [Anaerolineales bacterium]